jgi:nucleoside triphosphate pyrophosphatase
MSAARPCRRFVLASASPARARVLADAGIAAEAIVSDVDERAITAATVADLVAMLAAAKARVVAARPEAADALVLGCDSLLEVDGVGYGKPGDAAEALRRWELIAGRTGTLLTGHCLIDTRTGAERAEVGATLVRFGRPAPAELAAYVGTGEPLAVAGSFTLDGFGGWYVDRIDGDHGTVLGLSLPLLRGLLAGLGIAPHELWAATG